MRWARSGLPETIRASPLGSGPFSAPPYGYPLRVPDHAEHGSLGLHLRDRRTSRPRASLWVTTFAARSASERAIPPSGPSSIGTEGPWTRRWAQPGTDPRLAPDGLLEHVANLPRRPPPRGTFLQAFFG